MTIKKTKCTLKSLRKRFVCRSSRSLKLSISTDTSIQTDCSLNIIFLPPIPMIQEDFKIGTGSNIKKELSTAMLGFKDTKLHVDILVNLF